MSDDRFRSRYETAIREAQVVVRMCGRKRIGIRAGRVLCYLLNEKDQITNDFVTRCDESMEVYDMGRFWYWLQRRKRINEKHCGAFCLNCKFYCDCRYGDMNRKGKVIIELPRTPANAWLFEPIENHREVVQKEKKDSKTE